MLSEACRLIFLLRSFSVIILCMHIPLQHTARFRFHGQLTALLRRPASAGELECPFVESPAIKDTIEAAGVPHTEVDLIFANGRSVDFSYRLQPHDRIDIYPPEANLPEGLAAVPPIRLSLQFSEPVRFVLDVHLGKLARRLRLLGFDCLYRNDYDDTQIITLGCDDTRIILTRDRGLLKHRVVWHGYLLRTQQPDEQVCEVLRRYSLFGQIMPLRRCPVCNGRLEAVAKQDIAHRLEPKTVRFYEQFVRCDGCDKLYWQGSHYPKITEWTRGVESKGGTS
jgi:hypothetical protein